MTQVRIALIGKKAVGKTFVGYYLRKKYRFNVMRMDDGLVKFIRTMYTYAQYKRPPWETKFRFYDALYDIDPTIHVNYRYSLCVIISQTALVVT
jgi:hypothetical protein